jgi:hypothetical protein
MMKSSHRSSDNKANYVPYIIVFGIDMTRVFFNTLLFSIGIKKKHIFFYTYRIYLIKLVIYVVLLVNM